MMDVQDVFITFTREKYANIIMSPSSGGRQDDLRLSTAGAWFREPFPGFLLLIKDVFLCNIKISIKLHKEV